MPTSAWMADAAAALPHGRGRTSNCTGCASADAALRRSSGHTSGKSVSTTVDCMGAAGPRDARVCSCGCVLPCTAASSCEHAWRKARAAAMPAVPTPEPSSQMSRCGPTSVRGGSNVPSCSMYRSKRKAASLALARVSGRTKCARQCQIRQYPLPSRCAKQHVRRPVAR